MARPLRIQFPGAWYHMMNRGASRQRIFLNENDRKDFLNLLGETSDMFTIQIHAYCLLDNHYHLLIHTPQGNISRSMRHLNGVYTQLFNRKHGTDGSIFRGRFKIIGDTNHHISSLSLVFLWRRLFKAIRKSNIRDEWERDIAPLFDTSTSCYVKSQGVIDRKLYL